MASLSPAFPAAVTVALLPAMASAGPPAGQRGEAPGTPRGFGGQEVAACGWPSVGVFAGNLGCGVVLVHPRVVVTSSNCADAAEVGTAVSFGDDLSRPDRRILVDQCHPHPDYAGEGTQNVVANKPAFCTLASDAADIPLVPIAMGCEVASQVGRGVAMISFGEGDGLFFDGTKRQSNASIFSATGTFFKAGDSAGGLCADEDGGAGAFIRLDAASGGDDTVRLLGLVAGHVNGPGSSGFFFGICNGTNQFWNVAHVMPWMQGELDAYGYDITPCHEADGTWDPGPDCGWFPLEPGLGDGGWSNGCAPGPLGGASSLCGPPGFEGPDDVPPSVSFLSPADAARFETLGLGTITIPLAVEAHDDGYGVDRIELTINGEAFAGGVDRFRPFEWSLVLPAGQFVIAATAIDRAEQASSVEIAIGIDADPPTLQAADETGAGDGTNDSAARGCSVGGDGRDGSRGGGLAGLVLAVLGLRRRRRR